MPGDAVVPEAVLAADENGAAAIDAVVARRRSHLARLALAARTASRRREQAEAEIAKHPALGARGVPADLLGVVDAMLERALRASEAAIAQARGEAAVLVATATSESGEALRRAGIDPGVLASSMRAPAGDRHVTPPPTAAELWNSVRPSPPVVASPSAPVNPAAPPNGQTRVDPMFGSSCSASSMPLPPPPVTALAAVDADPSPTLATIGTLLMEAPLTLGQDDDRAQTYDVFWQDVPADRRVRGRLRRRFPKEDM